MPTATKTNWRQVLKDRMKANRAECLECLHGNGYAWDDEKRTLKLMNILLKDLPENLWPENGPDDGSWDWEQTLIRSGNWSMVLSWQEGRRSADLRFDNDDHTAWVVEHSRKKGVWVNFDIGGS